MKGYEIPSIAVLVLLVLLVGLIRAQKPIHWIKGNPEVKKQTLITIGLHVVSYVLLVASNYIQAIAGSIIWFKIVDASYAAFVLYLLWHQVKVFGQQLTIPITKDNVPAYLSIVCITWTALFTMLATVNYLSYIIFPTWYKIGQEGLSFCEVAFEFVYYTFSLMITYGSNAIVAISVGSKTIQIAEMLFFFIIVGNLISQVINKATDMAHEPETVKTEFTAKAPKVGRNDLCPCGSGKKYKKCCGR